MSVTTHFSAFFALFILLFYSVQVNAQEVDGVDNFIEKNETESAPIDSIKNNNAEEMAKLSVSEQIILRIKLREPQTIPASIQSAFLTYDELSLLRQARAGLTTALPSDQEINSGDPADDLSVVSSRPPGPRNIRLGGIVYVSNTDWTLWLNDREVRPDAIPTTVLDLKVFRKYIELEWFDTQTNQIYPIRIRPNQTFNLDSRLFIPG